MAKKVKRTKSQTSKGVMAISVSLDEVKTFAQNLGNVISRNGQYCPSQIADCIVKYINDIPEVKAANAAKFAEERGITITVLKR